MKAKTSIRAKILDFKLATQDEICQELGHRLKFQRLAKNMKQEELAVRSGVSVGTVKNLESKGQATLDTLVRIVYVLDLIQDLEEAFVFKTQTIAQIEKLEKLTAIKIRRRAR